MKKVLILTVALIFVFSGMALAGVVNSKHDMVTGPSSTVAHDGSISNASTSGQTDQVCVFCHHPHRTGASDTEAQLLWNRNNGSTNNTYLTYASNAFSTAGVGGTLATDANAHHTRLCLSCHDSTYAVTVVDSTPMAFTSTGYTAYTISGQANIGGDDLKNDHPVDFDYVAASTINPEFPSGATGSVTGAVTGGSYPLYGSTMQCGTCHDPHNSSVSSGVQFIRNADGSGAPLAGSQLCNDCHQNH